MKGLIGTPSRGCLAGLFVVALAGTQAGCVVDAGPGRTGGALVAGTEEPAEGCDIPGMGCACARNRPPIPCNVPAPEGSALCFEGTRYCEDGVWSECRDILGFAKPASYGAALLDPDVDHPQCSDCDAHCYRVEDTLDPSAGPLSGSLFSGISYDVSGSGIALSSMVTPPDPIGPGNALLMAIGPSGTGARSLEARFHPAEVDVYFLVDRSMSTVLSLQNLAYQFSGNGDFVPTDARCHDDDDTPRAFGLTGALRCLFPQPETGLGLFRDIPFEPYAVDQTLPMADQLPDAYAETAFRHLQDMDADEALSEAALSLLGAPESSGDPDTATSMVPALHALSTGSGMWFGYNRTEVPDAAACASGRAGYPCFRDSAESIVVAITDAPMHNGPWVTPTPAAPDPDAFDYGYGFGSPPTNLTVLNGTTNASTQVPATNDDLGTAYALSSDATPILETFVGTTVGLTSTVDELHFDGMCNGDVTTPDALFAFRVAGTPGGTADIMLSTEGSSFDTALAVYDGIPGGVVTTVPSDNTNDTFTSAATIPDALTMSLHVDGDTAASMAADYQGDLFSGACGTETANTLSPDALYSFSVSGTEPVELELQTDMPGQNPVMVVYEAAPVGQEWPVAAGAATPVSGNDEIVNAHVLPDPAGNYFSVTGNTSALSAKFDQADLGGGACSPDSSAKDAVFRIDVVGTHTLRFDTEGSSFDTVLSLHDAPPLTNAGASLTFTAAATHNNTNNDVANAWSTGPVDGLNQVFRGDTSGMSANFGSEPGCGVKPSCNDAVYEIEVLETTTLRLGAEGVGWEPAVSLTRHSPSAIQGQLPPLALGADHTCALSEGLVYCWGRNDYGQLGDGAVSPTPSAVPVEVSGLAGVIQVAAGRDHTCALTASGEVHCWGRGGQGQLGNSPVQDSATPVQVDAFGSDVGDLGQAVQLALGDGFSCALLDNGQAACWGDNGTRQLGFVAGSPAAPGLVDGGQRFRVLAAGAKHVCAIEQAGSLWCWGAGSEGQQGDGGTADNGVPTQVINQPVAPTVATHVVAGADHSCAVLSSGKVVCWGSQARGQLGNNAVGGIATTPQWVRNFDADASGLDTGEVLGGITGAFSAGAGHTCVRSGTGFVACWGENADAQLGDGTATSSARPVLVDGMLDAQAVVAAHRHSCALSTDGTISCWGHGRFGKLGDGDVTDHVADTPVASQPDPMNPVVFGGGFPASGTTHACRSSARAPEPGCVRDFYSGSGKAHAYYFCQSHARRWADAATACRAVDMELADINADDENLFVGNRVSTDSWIGMRRMLDVTDRALTYWTDFVTTDGDVAWWWIDEICIDPLLCTDYRLIGDFVGPMAGLSDADGAVWDWPGDRPSGNWGHNCSLMAAGSGAWQTEDCGAVQQPACDPPWGENPGIPYCDEPDYVVAQDQTVAAWMPSVTASDIAQRSLAGELALPYYAGGSEHGYACEEKTRTTDVKVDPGKYFLTVKGIEDGTACAGGYDLSIADLGSPSGGFVACNDNADAEVNTSVIERTLTTGAYYLVVKGKTATSEGAYNLTVRDVDAVTVPQLACALGDGSNPASVTMTAVPGTTYYAMVKGDAPSDSGAYSLKVRDTSPATANFVGCDDDGGIGSASSMTLSLATDTDYYAVLKGVDPSEVGDYRLTIGGAAEVVEPFSPPDYAGTLSALDSANVHVATVLSCASGTCPEAEEQAVQLSGDVDAGSGRAAHRLASDPTMVAAASVDAVLEILEVDRIYAYVDWAPNSNLDPMTSAQLFEADITTLPISSSQCAGNDGVEFTNCRPGGAPTFDVTIRELSKLGVPPGPRPDGSYEFTVYVEAERDGTVEVIDSRPLIVKPSLVSLVGAYDVGFYAQDTNGKGCEGDVSRRPSWDELVYDADVLPDTLLTFSVCTADQESDLGGCPTSDPATSGFMRVMTLSAGTGNGTVCTAVTEATDCPGGYCSPYTDRCIYIEGTDCSTDADCPGGAPSSCRAGPNAATLGTTCEVPGGVGSPATALGPDNFRPYMRMQADLESIGDGSRTPSLYYWEGRYFCRAVE